MLNTSQQGCPSRELRIYSKLVHSIAFPYSYILTNI
jgi:hypothetical protein